MRHALPLMSQRDSRARARAPAATSGTAGRFEDCLERFHESRFSADGFVLLHLEQAAALAVRPGVVNRCARVLELAQGNPWLICQAVFALARYSERLDGWELLALVQMCDSALGEVPEEDKEELREELARARHLPFLIAELELTLDQSPPEEVASVFAHKLQRLTPGARARINLDSLVGRCLDRMGSRPLASWLDYLLDTVAIRQIDSEALREVLLRAYVEALEINDVEARHRPRLFYLSRFASDPEVRAKLMVRHDFAELDYLGKEVNEPVLVLDRLHYIPTSLPLLSEDEARRIIGWVLRRLSCRLGEDDHLLIGYTLCDLNRPAPFCEAYLQYMESLYARASGAVLVEMLGEFFAAWLSAAAGDVGEILEPNLRTLFQEADRSVRRGLRRWLRDRFGGADPLRQLENPSDSGSSRRWPWSWTSRNLMN